MNGKLLFILAFIFAQFAQAQISPIDQALEYLAEFGQTEDSEQDLVQLAEQLSYLQNNPISLNSATADELLEIPLLNSFLAFRLLEYRNRSGRILSYYQLSDIEGFTPQIITLIKPFTTLKYADKSKLWPRYFKHQVALQYKRVAQESRAYNENVYTGDANALYLRYRVQAEGKLFAGLTLQKDAGEAWLTEGTPDFTSAHFEYRINKTVKTIVAGDYGVEFGQGLVLWSSLAFNKSSEAVTIARFGKGIRYFSGADENRFLRGGGIVLQHNDFELSTFFSQKKVDANLDIDPNGQIVATSLQQSGFHRTENEKEDKQSEGIQISGMHLQWKPKRIRLGFLTSLTKFQYPIKFQDRPENTLKFSGDEQVHSAFDWKFLYGRLFFFGEAAYLWQNNATALTTGLQVQAADGFQWTMQFRHAEPSWYAPYSQPFSETGREGEQGIYLGFNFQLPKQLSLAVYADHFRYLWLRSNLSKPGTGRDYMAQLNYLPRQINTYLRFRYQSRLRKISSDQTIADNDFLNRLSVRWHATFSVNEKLNLQTRIEFSQSEQQENVEDGVLAFVGASIKLADKWRFKLRYTVFDTDSYSSAIWAFEDDVPYSYSVPAFYENGQKWYAMVTWQAREKMEFWFRISNLTYENATSIGSSYDEISGAHRTEFKALMRLNF